MDTSILKDERIALVKAKRIEMYKTEFADLSDKLDENATKELLDFYNIFDERFYIWLAGLYDPEIGGFYYSESARDAKGFLPDIESTMQTLFFAQGMGLTYRKPMKEAFSSKVAEALVKFTKDLQDPENGYFYHPQWGRKINIPRRGRDLSWSLALLECFGAEANYPTPIQRLAEAKGNEALPEHLKSLEGFKKYLADFKDPSYPYNINTHSYWVGNTLQSQAIQFKAASEDIKTYLCEWLEENQRDDNGLWQKDVNYSSVNGLMKLALMYTTLERPIPRAEKALESAIKVAVSDEEITFCCQFYNPFSTMASVIRNVLKFKGKDEAERLQALVLSNASELIKKAREKVSLCADPDGRYRFIPYVPGTTHDHTKGGARSQMAPVALGGMDDPDVNGATICINGTLRELCVALGIPIIPVFCDEDARLFHELINSATQYPKIIEKPEWFDSYLVPEGSAWD